MKDKETKQLANKLYTLFKERFEIGDVRIRSYLRMITSDLAIDLDISGSSMVAPRCTMTGAKGRFSAFGFWQRRGFLKMYKQLKKGVRSREDREGAEKLLELLATPEIMVREAAKDVKTWI